MTWLIACAIAIASAIYWLGYNVSQTLYQMQALQEQMVRVQVALDTRDVRIDGLSKDMARMATIDEVQNQRITTLEGQVHEMQRRPTASIPFTPRPKSTL